MLPEYFPCLDLFQGCLRALRAQFMTINIQKTSLVQSTGRSNPALDKALTNQLLTGNKYLWCWEWSEE